MMKRLYKLFIPFFTASILSLCIYGNVNGQGKTDRIDVRVKEADLVDVINMLAEKAGYNIVVGADVSGKVTFDLHGVTVQDALDAALNINGYGYEEKGGIIFIKPSQHAQMLIRSYKVSYIDPSEIITALKENSSAHGKITLNKSNNIILIEDTEEYVNRIETILKSMDVIPKQVLIEAKILEIRLGNDTQLGVDWSQVLKSGDATFTLEGANFSVPSSAGTPGLFFNVATPHFNMFLDALQEKGDLKTLATPKLVVIDNKEAEIIIGGRLGYRVTTTINQVTTESIEFLDVGTMLKLTPRIGSDDNIFLSIYPKVSDGVITQGLPSETTTEVTTKVVVKDGESIFIGGLIRDRNEKTAKQIPILGDIPLIGSLFKRSTNTLSKTETIIVITPRIITYRNVEILQKEKDKIDSIKMDKIEQE